MSAGPALDEEAIRRLAALLEETGLDEIEIGAAGGGHVRVARRAPAAFPPAPAAPPPPEPAAEPPAEAKRPPDAAHPGAVVSPMVGTLFVAPRPGDPPFVSEGATVSEGDTMFIVEAMKTMNPVRAPRAGTVARVVAANASPVEYGELLAIIE